MKSILQPLYLLTYKKSPSEQQKMECNYINLFILDEDTMEYKEINSVSAVICVFYYELKANLLKLDSALCVCVHACACIEN